MVTRTEAQHTIVEKIQLFLQLRRRGWTGLQTLLDESHLTRPAFFLLRALEGETVAGQKLTLRQMQEQLFNPYATRFPIFDHLPALTQQGYVQQADAGYLVAESGRMLCNEIELAARAYLSTLQPPSTLPLPALAAALVERVHHAWQSPEPLVKAHQERTQRRLGIEGAAPLVQIEWAVLGLWEVRDDAHMAAWRAARFSGPVFDILSHVWSKQTQTLSDLISVLTEQQYPADIQRGISELSASGYMISVDDHLELTTQGQKIRDDVEAETNRIFFVSWKQPEHDDIVWLSEHLGALCTYFKGLA